MENKVMQPFGDWVDMVLKDLVTRVTEFLRVLEALGRSTTRK